MRCWSCVLGGGRVVGKSISGYLREHAPVEIVRSDDTGEWLWAVQVVGTDFWLWAFNTLPAARAYVAEHSLPCEGCASD